MVYFISKQQQLFDCSGYKMLSVEESLRILNDCDIIQFDTETSGKDAHIEDVLLIQFGNKAKDIEIVVDVTTVDIMLYKDILETKFIVGQNLKFDLQFLYNYGIIPRKVYDTMIVEQLLYLGYPYIVVTPEEYSENNYTFPYTESVDYKTGITYYNLSFSLAAIAKNRLNVVIDKTIRGEIIWRGIDTKVILYAANDVVYLEDIMWKQIADCKKKECLVGAKLECDFVPVIAYLEWCGIKLDETRWKDKMNHDNINLKSNRELLDKWFINLCEHSEKETTASISKSSAISTIKKKYYKIDKQGDLFSGFTAEPQCKVNWDSSKQVTEIAKTIGFDTTTKDKKTGEDKDSVLEKVLKGQKGINDTFLKIYFNYKAASKVCTTYGQGHLNAINPKTGRIHTVYKQLGAASGRMSCGSKQANESLAKLKKIIPSKCSYPNIQQLPADEPTRSSFVSEEGNMFVSCDYSALESRLGADIYDEPAMIEEYIHGSGDIHSLVAKACFPKELEGIEVKDIERLRPDLRKRAKGPEFAMQFGGSPMAIASSLGCPMEEAEEIAEAYWKAFSGIAKFKAEGSKAVRSKGYVLMCKYTGHKMYWWDHNKWLERQKSFTQSFWEEYRNYHKGTNDDIATMVREHFQSASKWDRMALNSVTQGTGIICLKTAMTEFFNWIVDNNYFNKVLIVALVHDEACIEYPKNMEKVPAILQECMERAAAKYCKKVPIPAKAEVGTCWIH